MGFISINKRFTVSGEELAAVVVEVSCTAPAGAFARGSVKGVELAVVIAPADAHAMPVPWDLGYRDSVSQLSESKVATLQSGITYEVSGNVVIVNVYNVTYSGNSRRFGPMPKGLRPRSTRYGIVNSGSNAGIVFVDTSGNIDVWAGANGTYTGQVVYTV